jgi:hypothetical protein
VSPAFRLQRTVHAFHRDVLSQHRGNPEADARAYDVLVKHVSGLLEQDRLDQHARSGLHPPHPLLFRSAPPKFRLPEPEQKPKRKRKPEPRRKSLQELLAEHGLKLTGAAEKRAARK